MTIKTCTTAFLVFAVSIASAGTVSLNPVAGQEGGVTPGTTAVFDLLIVSSDLAEFDTISLLMGTEADISSRWSFAYDAGLGTPSVFHILPPGLFGPYESNLNVGGYRFASPAFTAPLIVGQLSIDTIGMIGGESIDIIVSSATESDLLGSALSGLAFGGGSFEPVEGGGTLNIVPEPGTLLLLAALAPFGLRRR